MRDGLAERAAAVLGAAGYSDLHILDGGNRRLGGGRLRAVLRRQRAEQGVRRVRRARERHAEHFGARSSTTLMQSGTDMVVLDSRPFDEYSRVSIPTGVNVPGAELVLRVHDIAPSPDTLVVVNCAGRTRSIIGAQSLINAGVPNKVVALRNGTMGWNLAGFTPDSGKSRRAPDGVAWRTRLGEVRRRRRSPASSTSAASTRRRSRGCAPTRAARSICSTCAIRPNTPPAMWRARSRAPGGQLVQATDQYAGTLQCAHRRASTTRQVRAVMTASWLRADGLARGVRAGRRGRREGLSGQSGARRSAARCRDRRGRADRSAGAQRRDRDRSLAQPRLSRARTFRVPGSRSASRLDAGAREDQAARHAGAHLGRRRARRPRGRRMRARSRRSRCAISTAATPPGAPPACR